MGEQTALYAKHLEANGKIVDFGGWDIADSLRLTNSRTPRRTHRCRQCLMYRT